MVGGGSTQAMITILRNNKNLLRKTGMFRQEKSFLGIKKEYLKAAEGNIDLKKASKAELAAIRLKILKQRRRKSMLTVSVLISLLTIISFVIYAQIPFDEPIENLNQEKELQIKNKICLDLIADGDYWIQERHWHNAIFQYKKALEIFPNDYDINYRLAAAYCYRCEDKAKDCDEAKKLVVKILQDFPDDENVLKLKEMLQYEFPSE